MILKLFTSDLLYLDAGQVCTASTRLYIEKKAAPKFKELLVKAVKTLHQSDPSKSETTLGPQADELQAESVRKFLDIGKKEGQVLIGGEAAPEIGANFIHPTVFTDLQETADINKLEVFGPVLALHEFETEADAIRCANDTECKFSS